MQQFLSFLSGKIPAAFIDSFNPLPKWLNAVGKMFTFKIPSDVKLTKNHKYFQVYEQVSRNARRHQTGSLHKYNNPSLLEFKIDVEKWLECPQCKPMYKEKKTWGLMLNTISALKTTHLLTRLDSHMLNNDYHRYWSNQWRIN